MKRTEDEDEAPAFRRLRRGLGLAEEGVYALIAILLTVAAAVLLAEAAYELATGLDEGLEESVERTLDTLLLVFILVELLAAVRATMQERRLVAEPFLIVGMIASIKEIVVVSINAKDSIGAATGAFEDAMLEIGVLAGLLLSLAAASFLMRRKEREPEE